MKKTVTYALIAVIVGLVLTLTPLIAITKTDNHDVLLPNIFSGRTETPQDSTGTSTQLHIELFAVSFTVALAAYALFKYRITHSGT